MTREWIPGTVAMVTDATGEVRPMIYIAGACWHGADETGGVRCLDASQAEDARPLVVIDPEDNDAVRALANAFYERRGADIGGNRHNAMQGALRSLVAPPRPDEPTGLGAVVQDARGVAYVLAPLSGAVDGRPWFCTEGGECMAYDQVPAVRVLHEGVPA